MRETKTHNGGTMKRKVIQPPMQWKEWRLMYVMSMGGGFPLGIYGLHPGFFTRKDAEAYKRTNGLREYRIVRCTVSAK